MPIDQDKCLTGQENAVFLQRSLLLNVLAIVTKH